MATLGARAAVSIGYPGAMWRAGRVGLMARMLSTLVLFTGCGERAVERSSDALAYGSASEVERFLAQEGVAVSLVDCQNIRQGGQVTRGLTCMTSLSREQVATLTDAFGLESGATRSNGGSSGHCAARLSAEPEVEVWGAFWGCGPPSRGFGHLEIHLVPATGRACISTQYNWSC